MPPASAHSPTAVEWLSDLVRLQISLWDRVDGRLKTDHDLSLPFFEVLHAVAAAPATGLRVGDLARDLRITVGGASKLVDRVERAGLIARRPDPEDRRAQRLVLTGAGRDILAAARSSYAAELAATLDPVLSPAEQRDLHGLVRRVAAATAPAAGDREPTL